MASEKKTKRCDFNQLYAKKNFTARKRKEDGHRLNYSASELSYSSCNGKPKNKFVFFDSTGFDKIMLEEKFQQRRL